MRCRTCQYADCTNCRVSKCITTVHNYRYRYIVLLTVCGACKLTSWFIASFSSVISSLLLVLDLDRSPPLIGDALFSWRCWSSSSLPASSCCPSSFVCSSSFSPLSTPFSVFFSSSLPSSSLLPSSDFGFSSFSFSSSGEVSFSSESTCCWSDLADLGCSSSLLPAASSLGRKLREAVLFQLF